MNCSLSLDLSIQVWIGHLFGIFSRGQKCRSLSPQICCSFFPEGQAMVWCRILFLLSNAPPRISSELPLSSRGESKPNSINKDDPRDWPESRPTRWSLLLNPHSFLLYAVYFLLFPRVVLGVNHWISAFQVKLLLWGFFFPTPILFCFQ